MVWSFLGVGSLTLLTSMALVAFVPSSLVFGGLPADPRFWTAWSLGQLPGWLAQSSLTARRLHDLGKSAVWLFPIFAYLGVLQFIFFMWPDINNTWIALLMLPMFGVILWLIGAPGEIHDNRFGAVTTKD
jgi:uncharacterized membrane protein YhaH (DUF805 family)